MRLLADLAQLAVAGVAADDLVSVRRRDGDVELGGGLPPSLRGGGAAHRVGTDLHAVHQPPDGRRGVGVARLAGEGDHVAHLGLGRARDLNLVRGDCGRKRKKKKRPDQFSSYYFCVLGGKRSLIGKIGDANSYRIGC